LSHAADAKAQVSLAYERTLGRTAVPEELATALRFLETDATRLRHSNRPQDELALPTSFRESTDPYAGAALTDFCLALFNLNEFIYLD